MKYQTTPLFSIPLFYANIGTVDPVTMAWIEKLDYPDEAAGHDHTAGGPADPAFQRRVDSIC